MMKKPPLLPTLITLAAVIILCGLGTWQVQRLHWKENLLAAMDRAEQTAPALMTYDDILAATPPVRVRVTGTWLSDKSIAVGPRVWQEQNGYHIVTPLQLDGGGIVLVNRGWAATTKTPDGGRADITGTLRMTEKPNRFVPQNDFSKSQIFSINPVQIAAAKHLDEVAAAVLYSDDPSLRWRPANNHLQYAIFWFTMAGVAVAVFALRFIITKKDVSQ